MYTNYSKIGDTYEEDPIIQDDVVIDEPDLDADVDTGDDILLGNVAGCAKLNVRQKPVADGAIIGTLPVSAEVMIDETESTEDFYKVCTASGMEGYCMKEYITIQ